MAHAGGKPAGVVSVGVPARSEDGKGIARHHDDGAGKMDRDVCVELFGATDEAGAGREGAAAGGACAAVCGERVGDAGGGGQEPRNRRIDEGLAIRVGGGAGGGTAAFAFGDVDFVPGVVPAAG